MILGCFVCYTPPLGGRAASHTVFHPCPLAFHPDQDLDGCAWQPGNFLIHSFLGGGQGRGVANTNLIYQKIQGYLRLLLEKAEALKVK